MDPGGFIQDHEEFDSKILRGGEEEQQDMILDTYFLKVLAPSDAQVVRYL